MKAVSTLTIRLDEKHSEMLEKIKSRHHLSSSSKGINLMIESFLQYENEINQLREQKKRLENDLRNFRENWTDIRNSFANMNRLTDE